MGEVIDHPDKDRLLTQEELKQLFDPTNRYPRFFVLAYEHNGSWAHEMHGEFKRDDALWLLERAKLRVMDVK